MSVRKMPCERPAILRWQFICSSQLVLSVWTALLLGLILLSGCAAGNKAADYVLTPVTDAPTGIHSPGKFVWNDLLTDNVPAAQEFYGQLFGWTFETAGNYTLVKHNGRSIAGIADIKGNPNSPSASRWLCTLSVADVDKAVALTVKEGGTVSKGPSELVNRGRGALIRDPQGAQLMILYANTGDPEDLEPAMDEWLWHELWSNNIIKSLTFYQKLAGYDFEGNSTDYLILSKDDKWRAGIRYLDDSDLEMRWVPVVRVADTEAVAERAKQLGGKVLVEPRTTQDGGSVALLSDPTGARIIIQRWTAHSSDQDD